MAQTELAEPVHVRRVVAAANDVRVDVAPILHAAVDYDKRVEDQAPALDIRKADGDGGAPVWKSTSVSGAPDNSSRSHFSAMTRPSWLRRAVTTRHRHAIEQASRRWRRGRRGDSGRSRRKILIYTQL